ncbi:DUF421 domain-containing protein [Hufsiella ginkgonis]|uniref:DUF421 domain-containing protein n=1 Tax=Hufsiella ginkgonis TaxID=2695274 RepID=A0A7K1XSZ9_9SPHI|nr:YetF domain-containing protein [Hufsiella ginkgonis]MXV14007.1 DUF421 domain-containing protein [Hufsiella ginkgonis]
MKDIKVFDFHRIFLGDGPPLFLLEIVFRTAIMYAYTIMLLRFLGKRGIGQLSTLEVAIIISFGSAVGDPMMGADIPILYGIVAVTTVAFLQVGMERVINSNKKIELVMEGKADCLVDDGVIAVDQLKQNNLSQEDLFRSLRSSQVQHLGEVKKSFFETSGNISVLFHSPREIKPGLSVLPMELWPDSAILTVPDSITDEGLYSCTNCGFTVQLAAGQPSGHCKRCGCGNWTAATTTN